MFSLFLKDTFLYFILKGIISFVWVFSLKFYTNGLSPYEYGDYSIIQSILTYGLVFSTAWLVGPILRFLPAYANKMEEFQETVAGLIFLAASLGTVLFTFIFIFVFHFIKLKWDFSLFLLLGIIFFLNTYEACFHGYLRAERSVLSHVKIYSSQMVLGVLFSVFCLKYLNLGIHGIFLGQAASLLLVLPFFRNLNLIRFRFPKSPLVHEMLKYGIPLLFINLFTQVLSSIDQMVLKFYGMNQEVGIYSANYMFAQNTIFAFTSLMSAGLIPVLFQSWEKGNQKETLDFLKKMSLLYSAITLPFVIFLSLFKEEITRIFISPDYRAGIPIIPYIAFGAFFVGLGNVFSELLTIYKKTMQLMLCYALAALFNLLCNFIVIPYYGMMGAALVTFFSYLLLCILVLSFFFVHSKRLC